MEGARAADTEAAPGACGYRVPSLSQSSVWRGSTWPGYGLLQCNPLSGLHSAHLQNRSDVNVCGGPWKVGATMLELAELPCCGPHPISASSLCSVMSDSLRCYGL